MQQDDPANNVHECIGVSHYFFLKDRKGRDCIL